MDNFLEEDVHFKALITMNYGDSAIEDMAQLYVKRLIKKLELFSNKYSDKYTWFINESIKELKTWTADRDEWWLICKKCLIKLPAGNTLPYMDAYEMLDTIRVHFKKKS